MSDEKKVVKQDVKQEIKSLPLTVDDKESAEVNVNNYVREEIVVMEAGDGKKSSRTSSS